MSTPAKLPPDEILRLLAEEARADEEMDRILALSPEEVERELVAEGYDMEKVRADAAALAGKLPALAEAAAKADAKDAAPAASAPPRAAPAPVIPLRRRVSPRLVWLIAAALTLVLAVAAYAARGRIVRLFTHEEQVAPPNPTPQELASQLLDQAMDACHPGHWDECGKLLDASFDQDRGVVKDDRFIRGHWALNQALTVDADKDWAGKEIGPGLGAKKRAHPGDKEKPTLPKH